MSAASTKHTLPFRVEMMGPETDQYPVIVHDGGDRAAPFNRDGMRSTIIPSEWRSEMVSLWAYIVMLENSGKRLEQLAEELTERCAKQAAALAAKAEKRR